MRKIRKLQNDVLLARGKHNEKQAGNSSFADPFLKMYLVYGILLITALLLSEGHAFAPSFRTSLVRQTSLHLSRRDCVGAFLALAIALPSNAMVDPSVYNNEYADPFHPLCKRKVEVAEDGASFHYSGTAVGPKGDTVLRGCSKTEIKEFGLRNGAFDGKIIDGRLDAGDGVHEGVWEPKNSASTNLGYEDADGIRWNDGNKWIIRSQSRIQMIDGKEVVKTKGPAADIAGGIFYAYIGFSTLAGVKGLVDAINRKREEAA